MRSLCERPGCGAPADASYGIDRRALAVWIDSIDLSAREITGRLCRRHANALVVPRGWVLDDRREPAPRLFRVAAPGDDKPKGPAPRKSRAKKPKPPEAPDVPSLFASLRREVAREAAPTEHETDAPDPDETQAIPWRPRLDQAPGNGGEGRVMGRLLGQAFRERTGDQE